MLGVITSFWLSYAAALALLAARGHCITARWHIGPVCDRYFWTVLVTSPEVLVFMFFMITDPKTVPRGRIARVAYGAAIALVFVALAAPQRTEFATKVALLAALAVVCAARPILERFLPVAGSATDRLATMLGLGPASSGNPVTRTAGVGRRLRRVAVVGAVAMAYSAIIVGAGAPASTADVTSATRPVPTNCAESGSTSIAQPRPTVAAAPLPTVVVRNAMNVATRVTTESARQIVRDVIDDLAIAADAIEHHNPAVAAEVARTPWLDSLISTICATTGPLVVPTYRFDHATVTVAKRAIGQVFPEIDVALQGEQRETTITRSTPPRQVAERVTPFRNTFVVAVSRRLLARLRVPIRPPHGELRNRHVTSSPTDTNRDGTARTET